MLLLLPFIIIKIIYIYLFIAIYLNIFSNLFKVKRSEKKLTLLISEIIISTISFLIFNTASSNYSNFIDETAYSFRKLINNNFTQIKFISKILRFTNNYSNKTCKRPVLGSKNLFKVNVFLIKDII